MLSLLSWSFHLWSSVINNSNFALGLILLEIFLNKDIITKDAQVHWYYHVFVSERMANKIMAKLTINYN